MRVLFFVFIFGFSIFAQAGEKSKELTQKGDALYKTLVEGIALKDSLSKEFNKSIEELQKKNPDHQQLRVKWGRFSNEFNKKLKNQEANPTLSGPGGIPSTVEEMAKFEIKNYLGFLRTMWSIVSAGVQGRGFDQKGYDSANEALAKSLENAQISIKALQAGTNDLSGLNLKR